MNELIKNLGVIVLIIGAAVLAVPFFTGGMTNSILLTWYPSWKINMICSVR